MSKLFRPVRVHIELVPRGRPSALSAKFVGAHPEVQREALLEALASVDDLTHALWRWEDDGGAAGHGPASDR